MSRGQVQAKALIGAPVDAEQVMTITEYIERRATREPVQHITGRTHAVKAMTLAIAIELV